MKNKEYGSDFHFNSNPKWNLTEGTSSVFNEIDFSFFFSGRSVLYALLEQGILMQGWKEVFFPSFYCHEVVEFIQNLNIKISYYHCNPFLDSDTKELNIEDISSNVIVNVNYFGLKKNSLDGFKQIAILEDLTHSILDFEKSTAMYCFGSLRKELPIPVGGFCYSPYKYKLPQGEDDFDSEMVTAQKMSAMVLKRDYLEGVLKDKEVFRTLFRSTESHFTESFAKPKMSIDTQKNLFSLDVKAIIKKKDSNIKKAISLLKPNRDFQVNLSTNCQGFGLVLLLFSKDVKTKLQKYLIKKNIYPATLWPSQKTNQDKMIEDKMLFIHLDYRYSSMDVSYIVTVLNNFFQDE